MFKKINSLILLVLLVSCSVSYAQVGIGTETPTEEYEVKGSIRFRGLQEQSSSTHYRELRSDNQGRLTGIESQTKGLYFNNLVRQYMPQTVAVPLSAPQDLGVKLHIELEPNSETTIILYYNIPVFMKYAVASTMAAYGGVQLNKKIDGIQTILYDASRKFSIPRVYGTASENQRGLFVDGRYVDVIRNNSAIVKVVEYTLTGFIESQNFTMLYFSDEVNNVEKDNMGVGVISAMMFNKTF